jgi:hypothetical protein
LAFCHTEHISRLDLDVVAAFDEVYSAYKNDRPDIALYGIKTALAGEKNLAAFRQMRGYKEIFGNDFARVVEIVRFNPSLLEEYVQIRGDSGHAAAFGRVFKPHLMADLGHLDGYHPRSGTFPLLYNPV